MPTRRYPITSHPEKVAFSRDKKKNRARLTDQQANELRALCSHALGREVGVAQLATIVGACNGYVVFAYSKGYAAGWKQGMIGGTNRVKRGEIPGWTWDTMHIRSRRHAIRKLLEDHRKQKKAEQKEEEKPA